MKTLVNLALFVIVAVAMVISGYAAFEVLTTHVGINSYLALAAAIVIDAAALWLGHHAVVLAKLGDNTNKVQAATWFLICISLGVNFLHGFLAGGWIGGSVGIIYPLVAAVLFHFFIAHTIRETLRARGRILPERPVYLKSRKYADKARQEQIERDYVALTYETAETNLRLKRDKLKPVQDSGTKLVPIHATGCKTARQAETTPVPPETADETASLVNGVFAAQMLRDINETMTIKQIIEVLVSQGIKDYDELETAVTEAKGKPVSRATIRKTANRVLQDSETGE